MSSDMAKKALGHHLKHLRKSKKLSAEQVGKKIKKSQGYISGVENANRSFPTTDFISAYLDAIASNDHEFNKYLDELNSLPGVSLSIEKRDVQGVDPDSILDALWVSAPNVMKHTEKNGVQYDRYYDFPVNDISFHLTDSDNKKWFRKIELDEDDREYINDFINGYMVRKLQTQLKTIKIRYEKGDVEQATYEQYRDEVNDLIAQLKDSEGLKY